MIAYVRGRLERATDARTVAIATERGRIEACLYAPPGGLAPGDEVVAASTTIAVGVTDHDEVALLGPWPAQESDPAGPLGLASTPVILLPDASTAEIALAAVALAARSAGVARVEGPTPGLGLGLLGAATAGADVVVLTQAEGRHVDLVRILGGRAVVALTASDAATVGEWFDDAALGADVPIPVTDADAAAAIASLGLEATHQLIQVDPTPALQEAGTTFEQPPLRVLTAAASGVLAGRIAVGNRRWRAGVS